MKLDTLIYSRPDKKFYRDGDAIIKLFDKTYSNADILNEALNQARVEQTGLNIPKIREVTLINGQGAIVMDYIEGKTLARLMEENPEKEDEYMRTFIELQQEVHSKRHMLLTKYADKLMMKILNSDLDASIRYDFAMKLNDMPKHNHVCHGDFDPTNIVIREDGVPYIIDWSHASQGNATADAAKTYLVLSVSGQHDLAEKYLKMYSEIVEVDQRYIKEWIPLVAAAQLTKCKPEMKDKFLYFVNNGDME